MNYNYQIDNQSRKAVYEQIIDQIEKFILAGVLKQNDQLPSVRSLSIDLNLNPNTVQRAYTELERKKVIYTITGKGGYVSEDAQKIIGEEKRKAFPLFSETLKEFFIAGVGKEEITELVNEAYKTIKEDPQ